MTRMIRTLLGLAVVGLITACASPDPMTNGPTMQGKPDAAGGMSMAAMEPRMQAILRDPVLKEIAVEHRRPKADFGGP